MPKYLDPNQPCACTSGKKFGDCCRPFLRNEREAPDAVSLMRSRYSAFALENAPYLWRTLHPSVPERSRKEDEVLTLLRRASRMFDYSGLEVIDSRDEGDTAQVLFLAHMLQKGKDESFVERSKFVREGGKWLYLTGELRAAKEIEKPLELKLDTFDPGPQEEEQPAAAAKKK